MMIRFDSSAGGTPLNHHSAVLSPWIVPGPQQVVELVPSVAVGANSTATAEETNQAYRRVRQAPKLAEVLPPKPLEDHFKCTTSYCTSLAQC